MFIYFLNFVSCTRHFKIIKISRTFSPVYSLLTCIACRTFLSTRFSSITNTKSIVCTMTQFTKLYLWRCNLSDDHVHTIADALVTNSSITELVLGGNAIGDSGAATLAEMLGLNSAINMFNVSYNRIGDHGLSTLAYMLKLNTVLTDVDVSHNPFGSQGADALRDAIQANVHLLECSPLALPDVESRRRSRGLYLRGGTTKPYWACFFLIYLFIYYYLFGSFFDDS